MRPEDVGVMVGAALAVFGFYAWTEKRNAAQSVRVAYQGGGFVGAANDANPSDLFSGTA